MSPVLIIEAALKQIAALRPLPVNKVRCRGSYETGFRQAQTLIIQELRRLQSEEITKSHAEDKTNSD